MLPYSLEVENALSFVLSKSDVVYSSSGLYE